MKLTESSTVQSWVNYFSSVYDTHEALLRVQQYIDNDLKHIEYYSFGILSNTNNPVYVQYYDFNIQRLQKIEKSYIKMLMVRKYLKEMKSD